MTVRNLGGDVLQTHDHAGTNGDEPDIIITEIGGTLQCGCTGRHAR